jgi:hypothetical protein
MSSILVLIVLACVFLACSNGRAVRQLPGGNSFRSTSSFLSRVQRPQCSRLFVPIYLKFPGSPTENDKSANPICGKEQDSLPKQADASDLISLTSEASYVAVGAKSLSAILFFVGCPGERLRLQPADRIGFKGLFSYLRIQQVDRIFPDC